LGRDGKPWACPFCTINDGMEYPYAEVRSQLQGESTLQISKHELIWGSEHCGTPIYVDGPETIRRGLRYVTRMEPNLPPNPRAINLEVLTFYADAPVVPGSIERAIERARAGQAVTAEGKVEDEKIRDWREDDAVAVEGGTRLASLVETSYAEAPSTLFRRETPAEASGSYPYSARLPTDTYRPASSAGPSTYAPVEPQDRPSSSSTRLPLRTNDETVYRRMGWSTYNEGPTEPGMRISREGFYAGQHPRVVGEGLERGASLLVEPLPPSRFTAQMQIPPFRG
jgi:hypothetical protein